MRFFKFFLTVFLSLTVAACSRKGPDSTAAVRLVDKLPQNSFAFYSWGPLGDLANKPASSALNPLGRIEELEATIAGQIDKGSAELFKKIIAALKDANLIQADGQTDPSLEILFSVQKAPTDSSPHLTIFAKGGSKIDFRKLLAGLANAQSAALGKEPSNSNIDTIKLSEGDSNFFLHASQSNLAISTSSEEWKALFGTALSSRYKELSESKNFKDSLDKLSNKGQRVALGYVDVNEAKSLAARLQDSEAKESIESVPFLSGTLLQQYDKGIITEGTFRFSPQNPDQKHLMDNLSSKVQSTLLSYLPNSATLILALDGNLIHTIYEGAMAQADSGIKKEFSDVFEIVRKTKGMALVLGKPGKDSPFPEFSLVLESESPSSAMKYVVEDLHAMLMSQNMVGGWMEKQIAGNTIKYVMSPMGVGLFASVSDSNLVLSSSESAITATLQSLKDTKASLASNILSVHPQLLTPKPIFFAFSKMSDLGKVAEDLQGTFSLFTGGASALNADQIQQLRKLGDSALSVGIDQDFLIFRSTIEELAH